MKNLELTDHRPRLSKHQCTLFMAEAAEVACATDVIKHWENTAQYAEVYVASHCAGNVIGNNKNNHSVRQALSESYAITTLQAAKRHCPCTQ